MPYGLYVSAEGAHAQSMRMEVIANNLANVDTAGFKRELAILQSRYAEAIEEGTVLPDMGTIDDVGGGVMVRETKTDFAPGPLKHSGNPTDVAIDGEGFFTVQKDDETYLTRAGNFAVTAQGELVTQQGYPVLSAAGAPMIVNPNDPDWFRNLAVVMPESYGDLVHAGENLFRPLAEPQPVAPEQRKVAVGYVEGSAVKPTMEMTNLIEASRALEANVNMMRTQDEMLGSLVRRLMRVS